MPTSAAAAILFLIGFNLVLAGRIESELLWSWLGRTHAALGVSLLAAGIASGVALAQIAASRWPAVADRWMGLLALTLALFGMALLPQPWSYRVAVAMALRLPVEGALLDAAPVLVIAAVLPFLGGLAAGLSTRCSQSRVARSAAVAGALAGTATAIAAYGAASGSIAWLHGLAAPNFAAALLLAALARSAPPEQTEPGNAIRALALPTAIAICTLIWVQAEVDATWGREIRLALRGERDMTRQRCEAGVDPPNVLLVSLDTVRADSLGSYGSPFATPAFDAITQGGALFEFALAPASETAPSHATLLTGQRVLRHRVLKNGLSVPDSAVMLAERFRDAGYETAAFVSSFVLDSRFGWSQGFDIYDDEFPPLLASFELEYVFKPDWRGHTIDAFDRPGVFTTRAARDWLERTQGPFFLFVHYFDAHEPHYPRRSIQRRLADAELDVSGRSYRDLEPAAIEQWNRGYAADVLQLDEALAELLAPLASPTLHECTLVVVVGDHGQGLGQHGWLGHGVSLYDEQLRVPLAVAWPARIRAGLRVREAVSLADVAPTIAELAGLPEVATDGRSLAGALTSGARLEPRAAFAYRRNYAEPFFGYLGHENSIRTHRWKYIRKSHGEDELYDLRADPQETRSLTSLRVSVERDLGARLDAWLAEAPSSLAEREVPEEVRRGLEALGYVE